MVLSPGKRASTKVVGKSEHPPKKSPSGLVTLQRGSKPLREKRFYLDLKNHSTATRLENTLRSFGAVVDPFIGQEVNFVVTDRPEWGTSVTQNAVASPSCSSLKPSPSPSPLPCLFSPAASPAGHSRGSNNSPAFDSPGEISGTTRRFSRSRAEAMLDRVRLQPQVKVQNPLTDAHKWNIPIWTLEKVLKFLEKIEHALSKDSGEIVKAKRSKSATVNQKVRLASGKHFLKVEAIDQKHRPSFKDLAGWPKLNLDSDPGTSPFLPRQPLPKGAAAKKTVSQGLRTTQGKAKTNRVVSEVPVVGEKVAKPPVQAVTVVRDELLSGYCEVCKLDYSDLYQHIRTPNHQNYSKNNKNYASLDSLVNSKSLGVDNYLEKADNKLRDICAGGRPRNYSFEGSSRPPPSSSPSPPPAASGEDASAEAVNNVNMRQSVDDRQLSTKMVGRKDALEVHCNGISNHVQTRFACTKGDRENLGSLFLEEQLPNAQLPQLRRRRAISVSCRDLLQLSTNTGNEHFLRSGRAAPGPNQPLLSPALSDNSHPLLNSCQPLLSPTLSEKSHHLRPRGQLWLSTALLAEDDTLLPRGNGKVAPASLLVTANNCHLHEPEDRVGERRSIRRKRLSAEEKLIEDNRGYYKVEVLNNKLRSTGYYVNHVQCEGEVAKEALPAEPIDEQAIKEPVVVRFKKIRRSELSVLSDEAENFVFGDQKSESNSDSSEFEDEDEEEPENGEEADEDSGSSRGKRGRPVRDLPGRRIRLKLEGQGEEVSNASSSSTAPPPANGHRRYRRRRTNTETSTNDWDINETKDEWQEKGELLNSLEKLHFSFESIPKSEVWYQTFERQDRCEEIHFPIPYEASSVVLPYQLPRVEPSRPSLLKKRRHRPLIKLPRKSPRCHASTLAMLSSRHPFRTSLDEVSESEEVSKPTTRRSAPPAALPAALPAAPPAAEPKSSECETDMREIAKSVDSMLGIGQEQAKATKGRLKKSDKDPALNYLVDPEILEELACTCDVVANPFGGPSMDFVTLLDSYSSCGCIDVDASCNSSECGASSVGDTDRRRKKRKRRNMTGWDKPKKKSLRREVLLGETSARSTPVPPDASTPSAASTCRESTPKRKRKLRTDSPPSFQKGRSGVKRLKLDKESPKREGFRKRGRSFGWRRPR